MTLDETTELRDAVAAMLEPMICRSPEGFGGAMPGAHCMACCMGTGFVVGSQEELDLARLLSRVLAHLNRGLASRTSGDDGMTENERRPRHPRCECGHAFVLHVERDDQWQCLYPDCRCTREYGTLNDELKS